MDLKLTYFISAARPDLDYNQGVLIAFDIRGIDGARGGKGIVTANVLKSILHNDRVNEYLLYTNKDWNNLYSNLPNVRVVKVSGRGIFWHMKFYKSLLKEKVDVLVATESYIVPFIHDPKKLNVALFVHDLVAFKSPAKHQRRATWIERMTLKKSARKSKWIFTVSEYTKKDLIGLYPKLKLEDKITVTYLGTRDSFLPDFDANKIVNAQRRYNLDPDYLMMAGTLEPRKNIIGALTAFSLLSPFNQQRYRFVIAGKKGWYYKEIFKKVQELKLINRVKFLEYIPDEDLAVLMQGAALFLFPSFYEGFGLPVLEAMQSRVPVLASRVTSIPELGVDAIHYADPHDPVDIADGITQILDNPDYQKQLKEKGFKQVKNFSWGKTALTILSAIGATQGDGDRSLPTEG